MLNLDQQNRLREQYRELNPHWQPATETYAALVKTYLDRASRVLDLGCGRGGVVEQLNHTPELVTGVDPDWFSLVEHRLPGINRVAAISHSLPFKAGSIDLALASWLFEHLPYPGIALRQILRVLRPGGTLVFITPNGRHPVAQLNRQVGRLEGVQRSLVKRLYGRDPGDTFATYYRANTGEQLQNLARSTGFQVATLIAIADPTYLAFAPALFPLARRIEESISPSRHVHLVGVFKRPN